MSEYSRKFFAGICSVALLILSTAVAEAADRYWVGGCSTTNWNCNDAGTTNWGTASNTRDNASVPGASDDVFFDGVGNGASNSTLSANITVNSLDMSGYANTLTHNANVTLTIGSKNAANHALRLSAGMTYSLGSSSSSDIRFTSTSTGGLVTTAGKTIAQMTFNGAGGGWTLQDALTSSSLITLTAGTLDTNGMAVTAGWFASNNANVRTLTMGSSAITLTIAGSSGDCWIFNTVTNLTVTANTATVTCSGGNGAIFTSGTKDYNGMSLVFSGNGTASLNSSGSTFANLTRTGTAAKTDGLSLAGNVTVTGTFTANGNSATNRVLVTSDVLGTARTITAATVAASNADFRDITGAGAGSWNLSAITGGSGNAGGNSGITFTPAATQYWYTTTTGTKNWSTAANWFLGTGGTGGAGRVPLPQDDVRFDGSSIGAAGTTITADMPRLGKNIDWTGVSNTPAWSKNSGGMTIYGSLTMVSGMTNSGGNQIAMEGRGSHTLTSGGQALSNYLAVSMIGGTLSLQDSLTITAASGLSLLYGTLNANNQNVTTTTFYSASNNTRGLSMGSGTWTITAGDWGLNSVGSLTFDPGTSTIVMSDASGTARTFNGRGLTYNNVVFSGDNITVAGSNTFNNMSVNNAGRTNGLVFTSGTTQTVSGFTANGSSGNLAKISASTPGSAATLSKSSGTVSVDWMSIQDSAATGGAAWYAGANSTNVSGNSGWSFTHAPVRYWVGGGSSTNWNATGPTNWAACSGCGNNAPVPGATDDVYFDANSGAGTSVLSADITVKSLDMTGFTGTLTHNAATTLTIAGSGVNFKLASGMTYTLGDVATSAVAFTGTSGTTLLTTAGKTLGNTTFNGVGGTWQLQDALNVGSAAAAATLTLTNGTFDTNNQTVTAWMISSVNTNARTLTLGSSTINMKRAQSVAFDADVTNLTVTANTATMIFDQTYATFRAGAKNWNGLSIVFTGSQDGLQAAGSTFANFTKTGVAAKDDLLILNGNITLTGAFTVNGNSATNRVLVTSDTLGTARTITAGSVSASNVDFRDITGAGAGSWNLSAITGGSGDCGGNSGITFTPAATQTATGASGFTWSTHGWTTRVPLPQDDVVVNNAFSSGQNVIIDMPRAGHTLDFSGATWSGTPVVLAAAGVSPVVYGSLKLPAGITSALNGTWYWEGRSGTLANGTSSAMPAGGWQVVSAGVTYNNDFILNSVGGTYQLQDNYSGTYLTITSGTFDANGKNVTLSGNLTGGTGSLTRQINMGSGTWTITGTSHVINFSGSTNLTLNAGTSTLIISDTTATDKNFYGNGYTYNNVTFSGDKINVFGSNTFNTMAVNNAGRANGLILPSGGTQTVSAFSTNGSAGNLAKVTASTPGSAATLSKASGTVVVDYISLQDSAAAGGATWTAGVHSLDVSGNSGWTFLANHIYYSVGQNTSNHMTGTPKVSIASGVATFDTPQTAANMGVGDAVTYNTNQVVYITAKQSTTVWNVSTATGGVPADISNSTVVSIAHAFSSLKAALDRNAPGVADAAHLNTQNLTSGNYLLHIPCYYDSGPDTQPTEIYGFTTSARNYVHIYTPTNTSTEVNRSQRHVGKWDDTKFRTEVVDANNLAVLDGQGYTRIDGLQFAHSGLTATRTELIIQYAPGTSISNNIFKGANIATGLENGLSVVETSTIYSNYIWNNIAYDFGADSSNPYSTGMSMNGGTNYFYNNTSYNAFLGISAGGCVCNNIIAKNNIVYGSKFDYGGSNYDPSSTNNLSKDGSAPGYNTYYRNKTVTFADEAGRDFHLEYADASAKNFGADLHLDGNLPISTDIDGDTRPQFTSWDIGADESNYMPGRYWVGGSGTWDASDRTHWARCSGCVSGAAVPTATDDVTFDANSGSGTVTIAATANTLNLDFTGFTGTLSGSSNLQIAGSFTAVAGMTWSNTGVITMSGAGKVFAGAGKTFRNVIFSGDNITVTGSNTFNVLAVNTAGLANGLIFTSGTTQTVSTFSTNGSAGNLAKISASTPGSAATLSKANGTVSVNYMSIRDSAASGGAAWYAGANSTNVSGNSGWTFTAPPAATAIYRSVGPGATADLNTNSRTVTISGTTATFSDTMPDNVGVGDVLQYQVTGTYYVAFISARTSSTVYTVQSVWGGTPQAAAGGTAVNVYRAYTSLANAESGTENTAFNDTVEDFDTWTDGRNLVANNEAWNIALYANGTTADSAIANFGGWTTGASNTLRMYTPTASNEVGVTQRHSGKWDTGKYYMAIPDIGWAWAALRLNQAYTRVDGLQIQFSSSANSASAAIRSNDVADNRISNCIIRGGSQTYNPRGINSIAWYNVDKIWNNIIYDVTTGIFADGSDTNNPPAIYNNTIRNCTTGISAVGAGAKLAKNNLIRSCTTSASGTFSAGTDYNSTDNASMGYTVTGGGNTHDRLSQTFLMVNESTGDLHLVGDDIGARNAGVDLSADPKLSFSTDIDGQTRPQFTTWDIGADESALPPGRYWVGGGASTDWSATGPTNWAYCSGCANNAPVPGATDDVYFDANSGAGTSVLSADITVKSLDMTGYTGTLTHNAATTLTIAGSGVNFKLAGGMTYTLGNAATSALAFTGTSGTTQITTAGKTLGSINFNGAGGTWQLQDTLTATGGTITLNYGTFNTNNQTVNAVAFNSSNGNTRTLTMGSSAINLSGTSTSWTVLITAGFTVTANTAIVTQSGANAFFRADSGGQTMNWNGMSLVMNGGGSMCTNIHSTFANLTITGTAAKTNNIALSNCSWGGTINLTVTGTFTANGNSATNRLLIHSGTVGVTTTITAANTSFSNVDFRDVTGAGAGNWDLSAITGGSGDAGGNSGITFTPAAAQYWYTTTSGTKTWSAAGNWFLGSGGTGGAGRVPLPQDNVFFDAGSIGAASTTVSVDMPRLGKSIDFSGVTNSPTVDFNTATSFFGSMTFGTMTTASAGVITFEGRSSYTLTSNGQGFAGGLNMSAPGGTLTLQDDFLIVYSNRGIDLNAGTFNANNHNVNIGLVSYPGTYTAGFLMGSGTFTLNNSPNVWVFGYNNSNLTFDAGTSTIKVNITNGSQRNFFPGSLTYNNLWVTGAGAGAFTMNYAGSPTFNDFRVDSTPARSILFLPGNTYTFNTFNVRGTAGNLMSIGSNGAGTHSLVKSGGGYISGDYLSISDSQASPANTWYAGGRSTNATPGTNTGWVFAYAPIRYWVGGGSSTNWDATGTTNWAVCSGCINDVPAPTSADDVFFDANSGSGNSVLNTNTSLKSLDMTGYTGTLTHNAATTLTMAGNGGVFKLASGMTYTLGNASSSALAFTGTSGTMQITTAGKTLGNIDFNGIGGGWQLQDNITAQGVALTAGTIDTNSKNATFYGFSGNGSTTRTLTMGSSAITVTAAFSNFNWNGTGGLTITNNTATVTFTNSISAYLGNINWNGTSFVFAGCGGQSTTTGTTTMANLTITGTATKTCGFSSANNLTITGTLTMNGNSASNRLFINGGTFGPARTITTTGGSVVASNADFRDITAVGDAGDWDLSAISGGAGDAGGNTGIIFSTGTTNYWVGNTGNWSDGSKWANSPSGSGGTGRVPLPQDDVVFDGGSFSGGGQTITSDEPRLGKSVDWTTVSNTPTWAMGNLDLSIFGSLTLSASMGFTTGSGYIVNFQGRSAYTLTNSGVWPSRGIYIYAPGGTLTLQDDLTMATTQSIRLENGTLDANDHNVTTGLFLSSNSNVRAISMGSGTWTLTNTHGTQFYAWNVGTATNLTLNAETSTINITDTTATIKYFYGGNQTYNNVTFSGDNIIVTGSNTFNDVAVNTAGYATGLLLTSGTTQTITGNFTTNGSSGNRAKLWSTVAGSAATLSKASGNVSVDWMSIKDSAATGGATWYAGYNSDSVSGNSGWIFPGRNWVGGGSSNAWNATGPTNWATCSGCTGNNAVPTVTEDVFFDANSGTSATATLSASTAVRSISMVGWDATNTLVHAAGATLSIGDGTAGFNNTALDFGANAWTYTLGNVQSSAISFLSTSATTQVVNFNGKTAGNVLFDGAGASWQMTGTFLSGATSSLTLSNGTLDTNGHNVSFGVFSSISGTRTLTMGNSTLTSLNNTNSWTTQNLSTMTITANTATVELPGVFLSDQKDFNGLSLQFDGGTTPALNSANSTFANVGYMGSTGRTDVLSLDADVTITGTFSIGGNSIANRVLVYGSPLASARTITAATVTVSNVDFRDITGAGAGNWDLSAITGGSGDCGGNSGITFTAAAPKYWVGGTGNWSDPANHWATSPGGAPGATNIPLPQDNVTFDGSSFSGGGQTATLDMPRMGKSVDWTNATNSPTWGRSYNSTNYGSVTLIAGMTLGGGGYVHTFEGRGAYTFTLAGQTWNQITMMSMVGGSLTMQDDFNSTFGFNHVAGTFDINNHNFTAAGLSEDWGPLARTLTMGSGTWTLTGTGNIWYMLTGAVPTLNSNTSSIVINNATTSVKNFRGGDRTYYDITFTGDNINVRNSNTFNNFALNVAGRPYGINLGNGTTQTINGNFTDNGTNPSNMAIMTSITGGIQANLSKASGVVNGDYLILQDTNATGGATWYAGDHSINISNNSGWIFGSPTYVRPVDGLLMGGN